MAVESVIPRIRSDQGFGESTGLLQRWLLDEFGKDSQGFPAVYYGYSAAGAPASQTHIERPHRDIGRYLRVGESEFEKAT